MTKRTLTTLVLAAGSIAALAGCELIAGLDDTNLAQDGQPDASTADGTVDDAALEASPPDAGPPGIPVSDHDQTCSYGGAQSPMTVSCNPGQVITGVKTALFGRFNGSCTDGFTLDAGTCAPTNPTGDAGAGKHSLTTAEAIDLLCDGLRSCSFYPASLPPVVQDPCGGTDKQFAVQIECGTVTDAGVDAGDTTSNVVLDLDALDLAVLQGANVTSWKDHNTFGTATGNVPPPTMAQTANAAPQNVVRFSGGATMKLPQSSGSNPYLNDFHLGLTALTVVAPHGSAIAGERIFDLSTTNNQLYLGAGASSLVGLSHPTDATPPLTAYGSWNVDYLQLYTYVVRPLPADVVPVGATGGAAWGTATLYVGELPVAVGFQPLPAAGDRTTNLLGGSNAAGPALFADVGEILVYDRGLSPGEITTEQAALEAKWNLCNGADLTSDPANCGGCGVVCTAGARCDVGVCTDVDLSSWSIANPSSGDAGYLLGPGDGAGDAGAHPLSWAQAHNTCLVAGSQLGAPITHDGDLLLKGYFDGVPTTRERAVGIIREGTASKSAVDLSTVTPDWTAITSGTSGCVDMKASDGNWVAVNGCNVSGPRSWSCQAPAVHLPAASSCPVFVDPSPGKHAYAVCPTVLANDVVRKRTCEGIGGHELVIQSFAQAANVGALQIGMPLAFDLTSARKSPRWTIGDGSVAPFIGWDSTFNATTSIPPFVTGPACALLNGNGTMTDESCFAPSAVVCALPDGTPAPTATPTPQVGIPGFISTQPVQMGDATRNVTGNGGDTLVGVYPGDTINGVFQFATYDGRGFLFKVGFYPGVVTQCAYESHDPYPPVAFSFTAPPLAGVYHFDVIIDSDCSPGWNDRAQHTPYTFGSIVVVSPP